MSTVRGRPPRFAGRIKRMVRAVDRGALSRSLEADQFPGLRKVLEEFPNADTTGKKKVG